MSAIPRPVSVTRVPGNRVEGRRVRLQTVDAAHQARGLLSDSRLKANFEVSANLAGPVVQSRTVNLLVDAAHQAFEHHLPLVLSPDAVWVTCLQGLGHHVQQDAEALRACFVAHPGKQTILVRRDEFVRGAPDNDWPGVVTELAARTRGHVLEGARSALTARFSTTDALAAVVADIAVCSALQAYFNYELETLCGIPEFVLEGTVEDWQQLRERVAAWADWDLGWWTRGACAVLDECVAVVQGHPDASFWESFYHYAGESGGSLVTGNITNLFPYVHRDGTELVRNRGGEVNAGSFPSSVAQVPFTWNYLQETLAYQLVGGLMAVDQLEDHALRPRLAWVVGPAAVPGEATGDEAEMLRRRMALEDDESPWL